MIKVFDTRLNPADWELDYSNLPFTCSRVDTSPLSGGAHTNDEFLAGAYWTHQLHNFCPIENPTAQQEVGLKASENPLWEDVLQFLEITIPEIPPRDECYAAYINVMRFGNSPAIHCDAPYHVDKQKTVLVYMNPVWHPEWGGETVFFDDTLDAKYIVQPRPGRVVIFDGRIPHTAKTPSLKFLYNRFILAFKYMDKEQRSMLFQEHDIEKKPPVGSHNIPGFDPQTVKKIWSTSKQW